MSACAHSCAMVIYLNDSMVEIDECGIEMTAWYKEIRQLDATRKFIDNRLSFALSSLDKCRQRHHFLSQHRNTEITTGRTKLI